MHTIWYNYLDGVFGYIPIYALHMNVNMHMSEMYTNTNNCNISVLPSAIRSPCVYFYHHLYLVNVRYIIEWHKKKKSNTSFGEQCATRSHFDTDFIVFQGGQRQPMFVTVYFFYRRNRFCVVCRWLCACFAQVQLHMFPSVVVVYTKKNFSPYKIFILLLFSRTQTITLSLKKMKDEMKKNDAQKQQSIYSYLYIVRLRIYIG